jgi:Ca2+-binding RTX toxin-like protein
MASIPGGQFVFSAAAPQPVNVLTTSNGVSPPSPTPGAFNLEVITSPQGTNYPLPPGYQGVALLSDGGHDLDMLHGSYAVTVTAPGPDTVQGGDGNDTIQGGAGPETLAGGQGNDVITGGGPQFIQGGAGNDTIHGGIGPDTINPGSGNSDITMGTGPGLLQDTGAGGHDTVFGFDHNDAISFAGENTQSVQQVVATAQEHNGNTTLSLPDGSTITLVGVTHIDGGFFH